jgi:hypothetical protein
MTGINGLSEYLLMFLNVTQLSLLVPSLPR